MEILLSNWGVSYKLCKLVMGLSQNEVFFLFASNGTGRFFSNHVFKFCTIVDRWDENSEKESVKRCFLRFRRIFPYMSAFSVQLEHIKGNGEYGKVHHHFFRFILVKMPETTVAFI